jgi:hypothetical protein
MSLILYEAPKSLAGLIGITNNLTKAGHISLT